MDKDKRLQQILANLADAAATAADGVSDAMTTAGQVMSEKYDSMKLTLEISRLHSEQQKIFADIGRTVYLIQSGDLGEVTSVDGLEQLDGVEDSDVAEAQKTVARLLLLADQKQQELDTATEKLNKLNGSNTCAVCGKVSEQGAVFCATCGARVDD